MVPGFDGPELLPSPLIRRAAAPEERGVAQAPRDLLRLRFLVWVGGAVVFFFVVGNFCCDLRRSVLWWVEMGAGELGGRSGSVGLLDWG